MGTWQSNAPTLARGSLWSNPVAIPRWDYHSNCYLVGSASIARTADHHIAVKIWAEGYNYAVVWNAKDIYGQCTVNGQTERTPGHLFEIDNDDHRYATRYYIFDADEGTVVTASLFVQYYDYSHERWVDERTISAYVTVPPKLAPDIRVMTEDGFVNIEDIKIGGVVPDAVKVMNENNEWVEV